MSSILDKRGSMFGSKRAKWAVVFLILGLGVLVATMFAPTIPAGAFLGYFCTIGSIFLLGANVDSYVKLSAAKEAQSFDSEEDV